jgi:hypothetical protein
MLFAVIALVLHGAGAIVASAAASIGFMPQPADAVSGSIHFHGQMGHHTHGDQAPGHVHNPADPDHLDLDHDGQIWSVICTSAIIPMLATCAVAFGAAGTVERVPQQRLTGVKPDGLTRPPSTPSIA